MPPSLLRVCYVLLILATTHARPNWHKGVVVHHHLNHPEYSEAQIAAAQAIRDAGENAQLHLAMLKRKYMDIIRQNFYKAFAPLPFVKERLDNFEPDLHSEEVPMKNIAPQPIYIHHSTANNPCSGNILNCLHPSTSKLGKIGPSNVGLQPCFAPNCNHVFFNPNFKPMVIPKPSHTSHSVYKYPSNRPNKHRICDRRKPNQNCHHRSTFWPTYATVKFNTKLNPSTTTVSPKDIDPISSYSSVSTPVEDPFTENLNTQLTLTTKISNDQNKRFGFESLRPNISKLENEILGIPDNAITYTGVKTDSTNSKLPYELNTEIPKDSVLSTLLPNSILSTSETADKITPELKEDVEINLPLKTYLNQDNSTPKLTFLENNVIETSTYDVIEPTQTADNQKITVLDTFHSTTTGSNNENPFEIVDEANRSGQDEVTTENLMPTNKMIIEQTSINSLGEHKDITTEDNYVNGIGEGKTEGTTFSTDKIDMPFITNNENSAWKSDIDVMPTSEPPLKVSSPTTNPLTNEQQTAVSLENKPSVNSFTTTIKSAGAETVDTTITDHEHITRMYGSDLPETTSIVALVQPREDTTFGNGHEQQEFTVQTTFRTVQDSTTNAPAYLGRDDPVKSETSGTDSWKSAGEITTPLILFGAGTSENRDLFEDSATEQIYRDPIETIFTTTYGPGGLKDHQEAREDSYVTNSYSSVDLDHFETTKGSVDDTNIFSTKTPGNMEGKYQTTEYVLESAEYFQERLGDIELTTTQIPDSLNLNQATSTGIIQEGREDTYTETYQTDSYSTVYFDNIVTEGKESKSSMEEKNKLFQSTLKAVEEWTTETSKTTEYLSQAREGIFQDTDYPINDLKETTLNPTLNEGVLSFTESTTYGIAERKTEITTDSQSPSLIESEQSFPSTISSNEFLEQAKEEENLVNTSDTFTKSNADFTTDTTLNELPQLREGEEEIHKTTQSLQTTSETPTNRRATEGKTTVSITEVTDASELPESIHEGTPLSIIMEEVTVLPTEQYIEEITSGKSNELEEQSFETSQTIPRELFGKTDTPGLLFSEDWTEEQTEVISLPAFTLSGRNEATENPQSKSNEGDYFSEAILFLSTTEISNTDAPQGVEKSTQMLEDLTTHPPTYSPENYAREFSEITEDTTILSPPSENHSLPSYQSGVLKFTTEIETSTSLLNEDNESITNPALVSELNDRLKRKARSVKHISNEFESYPTTECVLCLLGLPHGHRITRSSKNTSQNTDPDNKETNKTKVLKNEKSDCSTSTIQNLEDPENPNFYASTILELLPLLREGYRNEAFNEEDKKVIRSLFGDMKALVDEETFEKMTESTVELLMGDGASRIDESIEDIEYDSSGVILDKVSDSERMKRSKKSFQIFHDLVKQVPSHFKNHINVPPQLKNSRVTRSTLMSQADASAILALLAEKGELEIQDDEDDDEYEYYEDEEDEYGEEDFYVEQYEDDDNRPSFGDLIKLAKRHKDRKARAEVS